MESLQIAIPNYIGLPYYPPELEQFMFRTVELRDISEVKAGEFFKPQEHEHKLFSPLLRDDSLQCELLIARLPTLTQVLASPPINFISEYRVYVSDGEILDICRYKGDPLVLPNIASVVEMVKRTSHYACAYGLDVGILKSGETALVEVNDFCCLGNYGLGAREYSGCIAERWVDVWRKFSG